MYLFERSPVPHRMKKKSSAHLFDLFFRTVCDCLLDLVPHSDGRDPGTDGAAGDPLPRAGQHL